MAKKIYQLEIEPITGVHIGTGETLTQLDYVVKKINSKEIYLKFSSDEILSKLISENNNLDEFNDATKQNNIRKVIQFFHDKVSNEVIEYPCDVTKDFLKNYKSKSSSNNDPLENALEVLQMYRPAGKKTPVIPGSSLKGAIRTAILDDALSTLCSDKKYFDSRSADFEKNKKDKWYEQKMQKEILEYKDPKNDPFRTLRIGDAFFKIKDTQLVGRLENISIANMPTGMQIQAEIIKGYLIDGKAKAETTIIIDEDLQKAEAPLKDDKFRFGIKTSKMISMKEIAGACNHYFSTNFEDEYKTFYEKNKYEDNIEIITKLKNELETASKQENTFILRVGRWSQVEFLTFQPAFRNPETPKKRNNGNESYGTTRTVFNYDDKYVPLGWCKCKFTLLKQV